MFNDFGVDGWIMGFTWHGIVMASLCRKDSIAVYIHSDSLQLGCMGNMDMSRYYETNDESTSADQQRILYVFEMCMWKPVNPFRLKLKLQAIIGMRRFFEAATA